MALAFNLMIAVAAPASAIRGVAPRHMAASASGGLNLLPIVLAALVVVLLILILALRLGGRRQDSKEPELQQHVAPAPHTPADGENPAEREIYRAQPTPFATQPAAAAAEAQHSPATPAPAPSYEPAQPPDLAPPQEPRPLPPPPPPGAMPLPPPDPALYQPPPDAAALPPAPAPEPIAIESPGGTIDPPRPSPPKSFSFPPAPMMPTLAAPSVPPAPAPPIRPEPFPTPRPEATPVLATPIPPAGSADAATGQLILLIEDDERIAKFYSILFEAKGYQVRNARDGIEGVDMATTLKPALILLDVMMPKMNGLMVLQTLRANPDTEQTPVVVLSNYMEPPLIQRALQLGAIEYVVKSQARPEQLVNAVPSWLIGEPALH